MPDLNDAAVVTPDTQAERCWADRLFPALSTTAIGIVAFLYILVAARFVGVAGKSLDLVLSFSVILPLPMLIAFLPQVLRSPFAWTSVQLSQAVTNWTVVALLLALVVLPPTLTIMQADPDEWHRLAQSVIHVLLAIHLVLMAAVHYRRPQHVVGPRWLLRSDAQTAALILSLSLATVALFRIDGANWSVYSALRAVSAAQYPEAAGSVGWVPALIAALLLAVAVWALCALEIRLIRTASAVLPLIRRVALVLAVVFVVPAYFEVSLGGDTFHYLTNMGPALHLMHGGKLMGDTFSQYGPGPIVVTALGFLFGGRTFGSANIVVQLHNLGFAALWLVCLYRLSSLKLGALLLGFLSIGVVVAGWAYGMQSINVAPSILGLRYLPVLLMVLAISCMPSGSRHSFFTVLATALAGTWSIEALVGAVAVHVAVIGLVDFTTRPGRFASDVGLALAPLAISAAVLAVAAGGYPDYGMYLQFLKIYNPVSEYWAIPSVPVFFGWAPVAVSVFLVAAAAYRYLRRESSPVLAVSGQILVYRLVPMAVLTAVMALYYVSRSVDYTLAIAGLPFLGLALPALIGIVCALVGRPGLQRLLVLLPVAIALSVVSFALQTLLRRDAPYRIALNECVTMSICSPATLWNNLQLKAAGRPMLETVGDYFGDRYLGRDNGMIAETVGVLDSETDNPYATVLLGTLSGYDFLTEIAYLHSGKWDRWPRSFTFSDHLVPSLEQSILDAAVVMQEGDLVIVNRDRSQLGSLEAGILQRVALQGRLCAQPGEYNVVDVYRFSASTC